MKRETAFFRNKRRGHVAEDMIATMRMLGMTDDEIKAEMLRIKAKREQKSAAKLPLDKSR